MTRVVTAAALSACMWAAPAWGQQVFRSGVETVRLGVAVVDKAGQPLGALGQEDFTVLEDGQPQQLQLFAPGDIQDADRPPLQQPSGPFVRDVRGHEPGRPNHHDRGCH